MKFDNVKTSNTKKGHSIRIRKDNTIINVVAKPHAVMGEDDSVRPECLNGGDAKNVAPPLSLWRNGGGGSLQINSEEF